MRLPNGEEVLLDALLGGNTERAIEAQEARGQSEFVNSAELPADLRGTDDPKARLEAMGVAFHGPSEGDPMFQRVTLPDGWMKRATDHSMWSELLDANGKKVASIFYKAAFYDRCAFLRLEAAPLTEERP